MTYYKCVEFKKVNKFVSFSFLHLFFDLQGETAAPVYKVTLEKEGIFSVNYW